MQITASQLQVHHKSLIDALKRGETVEITYHGEALGICYPVEECKHEVQETALDEFFGIQKDLSVSKVKEEVRQIRQGRRRYIK